jgi:hypothetical protein
VVFLIRGHVHRNGPSDWHCWRRVVSDLHAGPEPWPGPARPPRTHGVLRQEKRWSSSELALAHDSPARQIEQQSNSNGARAAPCTRGASPGCAQGEVGERPPPPAGPKMRSHQWTHPSRTPKRSPPRGRHTPRIGGGGGRRARLRLQCGPHPPPLTSRNSSSPDSTTPRWVTLPISRHWGVGPGGGENSPSLHRVVQRRPFITPESEDQPSPSGPRTRESQVECRWSIRRFECGESQTDV